MKLETILSVFSFGMSSVFWLVMAIVMTSSNYGTLMQLQASLLVIIAMFSLRTYDLVFYLIKHNSLSPSRAFKTSIKIEVVLYITCLILSCIFSRYLFRILYELNYLYLISVTAIAALSIFQGSTQAYLRSLYKDSHISWTEFLSGGVYFLALFYFLLFDKPTITSVLLASFIGTAIRPVVLGYLCLTVADQSKDPGTENNQGVLNANMVRFLFAGQLTNIFKNNLLALETLLFAQFTSKQIVALFRVSRSFLNLTTILLNISYQRTFRLLVAAKDRVVRMKTISDMKLISIKLWVVSIPIVFVAAYIFKEIKQDLLYNNLMIVIATSLVSVFPLALQQAQFASLTLSGKYTQITISYILSALVTALGCYIMGHNINIYSFLVLSFVANLIRYSYMHYRVANEEI